MVDGINVTQGAGTTIATDDAGSAGHVQFVKLAVSNDGSASPVPASSERGMEVDPRSSVVRLSVTPTISTSTYTAGDALGGLMTFAGASRAAGGAIRIESLQVTDRDSECSDFEVLLFVSDPTSGSTTVTDNAAFDPADADLARIAGTVPVTFGHYSIFVDNSVACIDNIGIEAVLTGTSLYAVLVVRDTPTYTTTSDLTVILTIRQL